MNFKELIEDWDNLNEHKMTSTGKVTFSELTKSPYPGFEHLSPPKMAKYYSSIKSFMEIINGWFDNGELINTTFIDTKGKKQTCWKDKKVI